MQILMELFSINYSLQRKINHLTFCIYEGEREIQLLTMLTRSL